MNDANMDLLILLLVSAFLAVQLVKGQCTFPTSLQNTWETSSRGTIEITATVIKQYPLVGFNVYNPTEAIPMDLTCKYQHDTLEFVVRSPIVLYGMSFFVFTCMKFVEVNSDLYYYHHITVADVIGVTTPEDVILEATDRDGSDRVRFCGKEPVTISYQTLLKQGTASSAKLPACPSSIFGEYTYQLVNSGGTFCAGKSKMDVCTDYGIITFDYTECSKEVAYSASGTFYCLITMTDASTTYVTLYNTDSSTDETTTYKFSCLALSEDGSEGNVKVTYHPEACETTQTSTAVNIPDGGKLSLTPTRLCPITTTTTTSTTAMMTTTPATTTTTTTTTTVTEFTTTNILPAILIPIFLIVFIVLLICFLYWYHRRQRRLKYADKTDEDDLPSDYSSGEESLDSGRGTMGRRRGRGKRKRKKQDDVIIPWKPKELTPEEMEREKHKQGRILNVFRGGKNLNSLTTAFKPKTKKISAWVKGRKPDIKTVSETIVDEKDATDIPGYDPHKHKFVNLKRLESGLRETGVIKNTEEESRNKRRQEAGFDDDTLDKSIIDIESLNGSDGEGVTFRDQNDVDDDKIGKLNVGKTPRTGRMTSFSRPVTRLMTDFHKEDESEYDTRVSDDETLSLDLSYEDFGLIDVRPSRKPIMKRRKRIHVGRDGLRSESSDTEMSEFDIMKRLQKERGKDDDTDVLDLDDLEKARLILKSRLFDSKEMESRIDQITEQFNNPASAKRFLMSLCERRESCIGRDLKPTTALDTDRQSFTSDVRHSTPHFGDIDDVVGLLPRPGTSWQAAKRRINQENDENQSGRWALVVMTLRQNQGVAQIPSGGKRMSTGRSVGRSLTWDEKEQHSSSRSIDRSNHRRAVRSMTKDDLPRRPHTTPGGQFHGVSPLVRINKEQTPSIYSYNFNPNAYKDIDDARLKRLLEELYKDKKFLDYVKVTDKNDTKDMAQHGIDFLLWRALFWEEKGMLPQRPPTSSLLTSGVRTNIPPRMYATDTSLKAPEYQRSKTAL